MQQFKQTRNHKKRRDNLRQATTTILVLLLSALPCKEGPSLASVIADLSTGHSPVCLKPACMFQTVIAFFQQGTKTFKNSPLDNFFAHTDLT